MELLGGGLAAFIGLHEGIAKRQPARDNFTTLTWIMLMTTFMIRFSRITRCRTIEVPDEQQGNRKQATAMKSHRLPRVSEVVRETAANAILFELKDPRVKNVTVTRAEVAADLQHAKVYVSVMGSEGSAAHDARPQELRRVSFKRNSPDRLTSRSVPHVTFVLDEGVKKSIEIARIIREEKRTPCRGPAAKTPQQKQAKVKSKKTRTSRKRKRGPTNRRWNWSPLNAGHHQQAATSHSREYGPSRRGIRSRDRGGIVAAWLLEELIFAICREGSTTERRATAAFERPAKAFVDWNEIRVSTVQEVADASTLAASRTAVWLDHRRAASGFRAELPPSTSATWRRRGSRTPRSKSRVTSTLEDLAAEEAQAKPRSKFRDSQQVNDFAVAWWCNARSAGTPSRWTHRPFACCNGSAWLKKWTSTTWNRSAAASNT